MVTFGLRLDTHKYISVYIYMNGCVCVGVCLQSAQKIVVAYLCARIFEIV